jgi:hypothetical protein
MATLCEGFSAAWFSTSKGFFFCVRSNMFRQMTTLRKRLSTTWLITSKRFFTRMPSKMDNKF